MDYLNTGRHKQIMAVAAVAMLLTMSFIIPYNEDGDTLLDVDSEDSDAEIATIIFLIISAVAVGYIIGEEILDYLNPEDGDTDEELREAAALNIRSQISNALEHDAAYASDESYLIGFTSSYFERMSEVAASELWAANSEIDPDAILLDSTALYEYSTLMLNRANIINSIFIPFNDAASTLGASSTYDSMNISLTWGSNELVSSEYTNVNFTLGTIASTGANEVYLYNGGDTESGYLYCSDTCTIADINGITYTMNEGYNSLANYANGIYTLQNGITYCGSMMQTYGDNAAGVFSSVVLQSDDNLVYIVDDATNGYKATYGGTTSTVTGINYKISYNNTSTSIDLTTGLEFMTSLLNASNALFADVINTATATWYVFDNAGESSIFVSPSMLLPNLANMDFTADQIYLIYMSALQQMAEYYDDASGNFDASDVVISEASLDLICRGTIYSDSSKTTVIADDVYFTPMCYLRDQAVNVGNTYWSQPGLAMAYEYDEDTGTYVGTGFYVLEVGNYFTITSMNFDGVTYSASGDSITLKVMSLPDITGYDASGTVFPEVTGTNWFQMGLYIIGVLGLVIGFVFRRIDFVMGGAAALLIGYFAGSWLWGLIS